MPRKPKQPNPNSNADGDDVAKLSVSGPHSADGNNDGTDGGIATDAAPAGGEGQSSLTVQSLVSFRSGVQLVIDRAKGVYRLSFDPQMPKEEFRTFFGEHIKPLLSENHHIITESDQTRDVRFHYQPETRDWEIRFRFLARDTEGNALTKREGGKQYVNYHSQVGVIANRVANRAANLLSEKLGLTESLENTV